MGKTCVRKELFCDGKVKAFCLKLHNFPNIFSVNILTLKVNCPLAADEENCYTLPQTTTTPRQVADGTPIINVVKREVRQKKIIGPKFLSDPN